MGGRIADLGAGERALVDEVARWTGQSPEAALDALLAPNDDPAAPRTTLDGGRFVALSLRPLAERMSGRRELALPGLDALRALDVAGIGLVALDLTGATALEELRCDANDLMVLDLRPCARLARCAASGNALSALLPPAGGRLVALAVDRNDLMVLDLGEQPALEELSCARNALVRLTAKAPRLKRLDASDNQLSTFDPGDMPAIERLRIARNRLATLEVRGPSLRELDVAGNYLDRLDLGACPHLVDLDADRNQLESVALGEAARLTRVDLARNRLTSLDLDRCPALERLDVSGNALPALAPRAPRLADLRAARNQLRSLTLDGCPRVAWVDLDDNPLESVDVRGSRSLARLTVPPGVEVRARPGQVGAPEGPRQAAHRAAARDDGHDRESRFLALALDPVRCARGTAVMMYWLSSPAYQLGFARREDVPAFAVPGWELVRALRERLLADAYPHDDVFFDPRDDQQTVDPRGRDWTAGASPEVALEPLVRACGVHSR